jgi:CheY-like chemotaxis protein
LRTVPTESALTLVDALAEAAGRIGASAPDDALRSQAAFVRALVDEVGRHHPADQRVTDLHEQLGEELSRLAQLAPGGPSATDRAGGDQPVDVLVVDDDDGALKAEATVVRELGYPCRAVTSAEEALREYKERPAAIVLSDWSMPGQSGLELCAALKGLDPHVYFILTTAFEMAKEHEGVKGVDYFLPKPVDLDELSIRLRAADRLVRALRVVEGVRDRLRTRSLRPDA